MNDPFQDDLLAACQESAQHQRALITRLAAAWGMAPPDVYYHWCMRREGQGVLPSGEWRYGFHGLECDMAHQGDGRFVRIEFGPGGRADCLSSWSVLQFIMTSRAPWGEYSALQAYLAAKPPPYDELSGDSTRMHDLMTPLYANGLIIRADPALYQRRQQRTTIAPNGSRHIRPEPPYDDPADHCFWDMQVCVRMVLATDVISTRQNDD